MFEAFPSIPPALPCGLRTVWIRDAGTTRRLGQLLRVLRQFSRRVFATITTEDRSTKVPRIAPMGVASDSPQSPRLCGDSRVNRQ